MNTTQMLSEMKHFSKYLSGMIQKNQYFKTECWVCSTCVGRQSEDQVLLGQKRPYLKRILLLLRLLRHSLAGQTRLASALRESSCRCLQGAGITNNYQGCAARQIGPDLYELLGRWNDTQQLWKTSGFSEKQTVVWSGNSSSGIWELLPSHKITMKNWNRANGL